MNIYHNHHIIPKHMGGNDDDSNIVKLSVEDHAEAHRILWEQNGKKEDWLAWKMLLGQLSDQEFWLEKSKLGGYATKGIKKPEGFGDLVRERRIGKKHSEETKTKISEKNKGKPASFKSHTEDSKKKLSEHGKTLIGNKNPFFGKKHSEETKRKISESKRIKKLNTP